jgi:hypothetical protein
MPADLWLICFEDFHKETDTYFLASHKVQESQTRPVSESAKE